MSTCRDEQFLGHLQQCCQRVLCRRQRAKSGRNGWHTDFPVLFFVLILFFVKALYHELSGQPDDIQRPQIAFHQLIAHGDERSQFVFNPFVGPFHLAKLDIEDIVIRVPGEGDELIQIIAIEEFDWQDAMRKTECQLGRAPVGPIEKAIEELVEHVDGIVFEVIPVIFDEGVGGRCFDVTGKGIDRIELHPCQRSIDGHEFVPLVFAHYSCPPCGVNASICGTKNPTVISLLGFQKHMMLSAVWSQLCVKAEISFPQRIPRLTDGDKELVPLSRRRPPNRDCHPSSNNHPISPCKIGTKCGRFWYAIVGRYTAISITSPPWADTAPPPPHEWPQSSHSLPNPQSSAPTSTPGDTPWPTHATAAPPPSVTSPPTHPSGRTLAPPLA